MGKMIGAGRTAEIFEHTQGKVLKLFRGGFEDAAEREYACAQAIQLLGLPVPAVHEPLERNGRCGIVYDRVQGVSLLSHSLRHPAQIKKSAFLLALLQSEIHRCRAQGLNDGKEVLRSSIMEAPPLSDREKARIAAYLDTLPGGDQVCHMDFHPDNILLAQDGPMVIDWLTAVSGNPLADVCRTSLMLTTLSLPPSATPVTRVLTRVFGRAFRREYQRAVCKLQGCTPAEIRRWLLPVAAARLREGIASEREQLLGIIHRELSDL